MYMLACMHTCTHVYAHVSMCMRMCLCACACTVSWKNQRPLEVVMRTEMKVVIGTTRTRPAAMKKKPESVMPATW